MATAFNPQVGDIGHEIVVDFETCDCDGKIIPLDLSPPSTVITICLRKPDKTTVKTFPGTVSTCGTLALGVAAYVTVSAADLDADGTWLISGKVAFADGRVFRGNSKNLVVENPICP